MRKAHAGESESGFVLPVVIFGLALVSTVAIAALMASSDEHLAARAMRESSEAFYAAEAGANQLLADFPEEETEDLDPGEDVELEWAPLSHGAAYRAVINRYDNGSQPLYVMEVEGRGAGTSATAGQRMLSYVLTRGPSTGYTFGECCDAAATVRGNAQFGWDDWADPPFLDGHDHVPPGLDDYCPAADNDKAGLAIPDADDFDNDSPGGWVDGDPPILEKPGMVDDDWNDFGGLSYEDLRDMADHDLRGSSWSDENSIDASEIYPRYNQDGSCDTSHPMNWGSNDPDDPCFTFHPIILVGKRELDTDAPGGDPDYVGFGQGIILLDWEEGSSNASEFDMAAMDFRGLILGRGCIEIQGNTMVRGAIFTDGDYLGGCDANFEDAYKQEHSGSVQYSQCAIDRAIYYAGLEEHAEAEFPGTMERLAERAFHEVIR